MKIVNTTFSVPVFAFFLMFLPVAAQPQPTTVVPVKLINGLPYLEASINGKGPYLFGFDSGFGGQLELDADLAETLHLNTNGQTVVGDGSGNNEVTLQTTFVPHFKIGNYASSGCTAILRQQARKNVPGMEAVKGIIGMGMFPDQLLTLDYPQQLFSISEGSLPKADNQSVFDYEAVGGGIPKIKIQAGNQELEAVIDTRSMSGSFKIPEQTATKLTFLTSPKLIGKGRTISNTIEINEVQIQETIKVGQFLFEKPLITYPSLNENAIIGSVFLQSFSVTIDTKSHRLQLKKGPEPQKNKELLIYEGWFGDRHFTIEGNHLYVQRPGGQKLKMLQTAADTFTLELVPEAILQFERDAANTIQSVKVSKGDGRWETANKTS